MSAAADQARDFSRVKNPNFAIIHQIAAAIAFFQKRYCYFSQEELRARVARHCGWRISRRTLNRHLLAMEQDGYLVRQRRHRHVKGKGLEMHSTLYTLTAKSWRWLSKIFQAAREAVSWGVKRVTHSAQYNPYGDNNTAAGPSDPARQRQKEPPDGGGGTKQTTHGIVNGLQSLREVLNRGRR